MDVSFVDAMGADIDGLCDWSVRSQISTAPSARDSTMTPGRVGLHLPAIKYASENGLENTGASTPSHQRLNDQSPTLR